ncbi:MAG: alpha/beta fold hydrolase [Alphaproteobacteria bacterium]|nr:alpha/beta fold hydrolase [Alphaproteobacteria bacterium]
MTQLDGPLLDGPRVEPADGQPPRALVVMLHGLGADGNDLISIAPLWAPHLPFAAFVAPDAPEPCDMAPFGRQWFSLQDRDPQAMLAGVRAAAPILDAFLDAELDRLGLGADRLALVGFSQGTMTALYTAPRRPAPVAGIVGYSGALLSGPGLAAEAAATPPVLLIHGTADPIVPFAAMAAARNGLEAAGFMVETHERPGLGHGIDEEGLRLALGFLQRVLGD